ncbi:MAG: DeoR family transcriptional regulator, partial [Candidatus Cloacimonetes bacterium]|nr:DeoR family transcriptional regulator [Candidatus Cloacimonadota bacterium]
ENFIKNHIRLQTELTGDSWERKEKWEYPIIALREAVINALIHRDYRDLSETDIAIFDDRIEIWSASKLPKKITVSDLLKPHRSVLRNPTIANLFFLAGEIEKFGTGIKKMIDACNKFRLPIPEFDNSSNAFFVTFRKAKLPEEIMKNLSLTERQKKILEYVLLHRKITNRDYRKLFPSISGETVRLCLNNLVKKGILEKVGTTKGTFYILSPKLFPNYLQISKDIPSKPIE